MARKKLWPMPSDRFNYGVYLEAKFEAISDEQWDRIHDNVEKWRKETFAKLEQERNTPKQRRYEPLTGTWHCPECGQLLDDNEFICPWVFCKQKLY